ncbi:aspartate-semialdehyde dehydrogenase [Klebsiella pneumoniae]|nr:aspartate-semialdehyde dehydrogenase [Klebsiella pneumoniae]
MKNVGFIGWRGMVGSVLMQRMVEERDFDAIRPVRAAIIPTKSIQSFVKADGKVTGLTQHHLCA